MNKDCPYCNINLPLEHHDEQLFLWHLNGHLVEPISNEWEEELESIWKRYTADLQSVGYNNIYDFIRKTRAEAKDEARKEVREKVEKIKPSSDTSKLDSSAAHYRVGYLNAIDDILAFLSDNKKK